MRIGTLVQQERFGDIYIGIIIETWKTSDTGKTMVSVEWNKNMGIGFHFDDELEVVCE